MIAPERLRPLLDEQPVAVSIYGRIDPEQRDLRAPEARLRNMLDEAARALEAERVPEDARAIVLEQGHAACAAADFATHRARCIVLFLSPTHRELLAIPIELPEGVVVARHFHIKPLLPLLARERRFHILALSGKNVRLFTATPTSCTERVLEFLPVELAAELDARAAADLASEEARREQAKELMLSDPHHVGAAVRAALGPDEAPIVLAAEPRVQGYAEALGLDRLFPERLQINPFALSPSELHERALALIAPVLDAERDAVLDQVNARLGTAEPTVAIRLEEILRAADEGRVDALLVAEDRALWGTYNPGRVPSAHGHKVPGDEDLLNEAAVLALRNGGRVFTLAAEGMPRQSLAAATLRF